MSREKISLKQINRQYGEVCTTAFAWGASHAEVVGACLVAVFMLGQARDAYAANNGNPLKACVELLDYVEGGFASLVAAAAGLGAIIAAAVGGFKAAWSLLVISVGAFILRSYISVFLAACK